MSSRAERGQSKANQALDITIEVTTWVTKQVGGDGSGTRLFEEPFVAGDTVRTVLRRFSRRFPELDAALWNPDRTELGEPIEVVVNDAVLGVHHTLDTPLEGGERITLLGQFMGGGDPPLPDYRLRARNTSKESENAIHDDRVAKQYGFARGLVPGVTVYAYMTHPLVVAWGPEWLERGTASVRFVKPVLDEDETVVGGTAGRPAGGPLSATVTVSTGSGGLCSTGIATLPDSPPAVPDGARYGVAPLPSTRPPAVGSYLAAQKTLGTPVNRYDEAAAAEWLTKVSDDLPVYRGREGFVHPAFYLHQANKALSLNVKLGPWIHVGSVIQHLAAARLGQTLSTRGGVRSVFEKKGKEFVELDLLILADERPVAHVLHTAIFRLPPAS
jgi:molybdopterin converting factor small subunit